MKKQVRKKISAEARQRISEAMTARWARVRAARAKMDNSSSNGEPFTPVPMPELRSVIVLDGQNVGILIDSNPGKFERVNLVFIS